MEIGIFHHIMARQTNWSNLFVKRVRVHKALCPASSFGDVFKQFRGVMTRAEDASSGGVHLSQVEIRQNVSRLRGQVEILDGHLVVASNSETGKVHGTQLQLAVDPALRKRTERRNSKYKVEEEKKISASEAENMQSLQNQ